MSSYAHWSPDGRHLAFDVDTGTTVDMGRVFAGQKVYTHEISFDSAATRYAYDFSAFNVFPLTLERGVLTFSPFLK